MLSDLLSLAGAPADAVPWGARRVVILFALALLLWSGVFAGLVGLVFAGHAWLAPHAGEVGAWAIAGGVVTAACAFGSWLSMRALRPSAPQAAPLTVLVDLVDQHPVEAVCVAGVTGLLVSSADIGKLLLEQLTAHRREPS